MNKFGNFMEKIVSVYHYEMEVQDYKDGKPVVDNDNKPVMHTISGDVYTYKDLVHGKQVALKDRETADLVLQNLDTPLLYESRRWNEKTRSQDIKYSINPPEQVFVNNNDNPFESI